MSPGRIASLKQMPDVTVQLPYLDGPISQESPVKPSEQVHLPPSHVPVFEQLALEAHGVVVLTVVYPAVHSEPKCSQGQHHNQHDAITDAQ